MQLLNYFLQTQKPPFLYQGRTYSNLEDSVKSLGISSGNSLGNIGRRVGWGKQNHVELQNSHCSVLWLACCELVGQVHLQCHDWLNPQKQGMRQTFLS